MNYQLKMIYSNNYNDMCSDGNNDRNNILYDNIIILLYIYINIINT